MDIWQMLIFIAIIFGLCFLFDKGFTKLFRGKQQHKSGQAVRLSKRYASLGLVFSVLGLSAVFTGVGVSGLLVGGGCFLIVVGICMVIYYMSFGLYYDDDSFILATFGKRSITYRYNQIQGQQLYNSYGNTVIELYMADGNSVQLQSSMDGIYTFLDKAFLNWLQQTGRSREECAFYDPGNSCWFPKMEE